MKSACEIEYDLCSGGSKGGRKGRAPPPDGQNFFIFMQFSAKIYKIIGWRPPLGVGAPSSGKSWIRHCCAFAVSYYSILGYRICFLSLTMQYYESDTFRSL